MPPKNNPKIIAFDLDDTICFRPEDVEEFGVDKYDFCEPMQVMVDVVNEAYDAGYKIVIYTARGMDQFNRDVHKIYQTIYNKTLNQLDEWGVKYHELVMGKYPYDILVDDKVLNAWPPYGDRLTLDDIEELIEEGNGWHTSL